MPKHRLSVGVISVISFCKSFCEIALMEIMTISYLINLIEKSAFPRTTPSRKKKAQALCFKDGPVQQHKREVVFVFVMILIGSY